MKKSKMLLGAATVALMGALWTANAQAGDVNIVEGMPYVEFTVSGETIRVERIQDEENVLSGGYTKTSRKCPPFCVQPMHLAPGVTTVGELELLDFVKTKVSAGTGVLIDARTASWYEKGTIPGSVNIAFTDFGSEDELLLGLAMIKVGVRKKENSSFFGGLWDSVAGDGNSQWDFSKAKDILLWCNGMWCGQSPTAIKNLLKHGFPAEKIFWYRDGMQSWQSLGLTVKIPAAK
jgi:rhodanese-related sulfurtransferase